MATTAPLSPTWTVSLPATDRTPLPEPAEHPVPADVLAPLGTVVVTELLMLAVILWYATQAA